MPASATALWQTGLWPGDNRRATVVSASAAHSEGSASLLGRSALGRSLGGRCLSGGLARRGLRRGAGLLGRGGGLLGGGGGLGRGRLGGGRGLLRRSGGLGGCLLGRRRGLGSRLLHRRRLGDLPPAGDDLLELGARPERRNRRLLDPNLRAGGRVSADAGGTIATLEGAEAGQDDLLALRHVGVDLVQDRVQDRGGGLVVGIQSSRN